MGSNQKTPQKSIAKLRYFSWGTFVLLLFQLIINTNLVGYSKYTIWSLARKYEVEGIAALYEDY